MGIEHVSIICFKLAYNCQSNELKNSKYGHKIDKKSSTCRTAGRLQTVFKSRDFYQGERKRFNLIRNMLKILI